MEEKEKRRRREKFKPGMLIEQRRKGCAFQHKERIGLIFDSFSSQQADKLQTLLGAAKVQEVEPIWTSIFAKVNTNIFNNDCKLPR